MGFELQDRFGNTTLVFPNLNRKTFETRLFSFEIGLEFIYNNEHDFYYYDEKTDEPAYEIKKEYMNFVSDFLNMLDGDFTDDEKINYFNDNFNSPYKNMKDSKLVKK